MTSQQKILIASALLLLFYCSCVKAISSPILPDSACDVITLKNGKLIYCKIKHIGPYDIEYTSCTNDKGPKLKIKTDSATMVNYPNGKYYVINIENDNTKYKDTVKHPFLYFSLSAGSCNPNAGGTYGSSQYNIYDNLYAGFASPGFSCGVTCGIRERDGWELTISGNYANNSMDANSFVQENQISGLIGGYKNERYPDGIGSSGVSGGAYAYSLYSLLIGPSKYFSIGRAYIGLHILFGTMHFNLPAINGSITYIGYDTASKQALSKTFNFDFSGAHDAVFAFNFGGRLGAHITKRLSIYATADWIVSQIDNLGSSVVTDEYGVVVGGHPLSSSLTVFTLTGSIGIEYGF